MEELLSELPEEFFKTKVWQAYNDKMRLKLKPLLYIEVFFSNNVNLTLQKIIMSMACTSMCPRFEVLYLHYNVYVTYSMDKSRGDAEYKIVIYIYSSKLQMNLEVENMVPQYTVHVS